MSPGEWTDHDQVVWNCIEGTRISNPDIKATPAQVRSEVWMAIIHGSMGIIYFVHEWAPRFNESALLDEAEMLSAVTAINQRITELAPALNSPNLPEVARATSDDPDIPIALMARQHGGATYLFAAAIRDGVFTDRFESYGVHLYRIE